MVLYVYLVAMLGDIGLGLGIHTYSFTRHFYLCFLAQQHLEGAIHFAISAVLFCLLLARNRETVDFILL